MITEENKLPEAILVIANPIPRTNNGGISAKLKWANACLLYTSPSPRD